MLRGSSTKEPRTAATLARRDRSHRRIEGTTFALTLPADSGKFLEGAPAQLQVAQT